MHVAQLQTVDCLTVLASAGTIINASATGLLIRVHRRALHPELVRGLGALAGLQGAHVATRIVEMGLDIEGMIVRIQHATLEWIDIALDLTDSAPTYWRECLVDLLPGLGEMCSESVS